MGQIPSQHKSDPLTDRVNLLVLNQTVGFTAARNSVTRFLVGKGRESNLSYQDTARCVSHYGKNTPRKTLQLIAQSFCHVLCCFCEEVSDISQWEWNLENKHYHILLSLNHTKLAINTEADKMVFCQFLVGRYVSHIHFEAQICMRRKE
jgi:hypothetical protein